jgi:hypothetical protein
VIISKTGSDYKPVPAGTYTACCIRVIDLGTQISSFNGKAQRKVLFTWEIPEVEVETDDGPMPALISTRYTASLHEKAALRKVLESWRGKAFTADELQGFDLKNILGASCLMGIIHNDSDGTTYANVSSVMALPKGMPKITPAHPLINFSLDEFNEGVFDMLSPKMQETIKESPEYKRATGQIVDDPSPHGGGGDGGFGMDPSDEIPFVSRFSIT